MTGMSIANCSGLLGRTPLRQQILVQARREITAGLFRPSRPDSIETGSTIAHIAAE